MFKKGYIFIVLPEAITQTHFAPDLKTFKVNPGEKVYDIITSSRPLCFSTDFQIRPGIF